MSKGLVFLDRGSFDHAFFKPEPYTEWQAWTWLYSHAAWKDCKVRGKHGPVSLKRGQLCYSQRFLATKWMWPKSRVLRFLRRLKTEAMIGPDSGPDQTIITICNYERFQNVKGYREPEDGPQSGPETDRDRTKEENPIKPEKTNYRFFGKVIRLNDEDYKKWRESYSFIPNLDSELQRLDDYYAGLNDGKVPNWFVRTSGALNKKNQEFAERARMEGARDGPQLSRRERDVVDFVRFGIPPRDGDLPNESEIATLKAKCPAEFSDEVRANG